MSVIENKQPIPARLYNAAKGGHVAGTIDIIDDTLEKTQDQINQETVGTETSSLKNRINAVQMLIDLSGTGEPVSLTTNSEDIVTTGEGAIKIPLCIAVAGKFAEYYNKLAIDEFIHTLELVDAGLLGTDLDTANTDSIKGLRRAIVELSLGVVGTDEDSSEANTLNGLRAAISQISELLQGEIENRQSQYNGLLGTEEDSFSDNTIMGLRKTIVGLSDIVNGLTPGDGGEGSGTGLSVEQYNFLEELRVTKLPKLERDVSNILSILDTDNSSEQIQAIINKYNQISEFIQNLGDGDDSEEALSNIITRVSNLENDISRLNRLIENIHVGGSSTGGMKHIVLTESQYDTLEEYEEDALYLITEDEEGWVFPIILQEVEQTFPIELT